MDTMDRIFRQLKVRNRESGATPALAIVVAALWAGPGGAGAQEGSDAVDLEAALIGDAMTVVSGGRSRGGELLWNVDLQLVLDEGALWSGGKAFFYVLGNGGDDPTRRVGDFQVVNNIAAPSTWKLFEAWIEQGFAGGSAAVLAGLYDLNSEFDVLGSAQLFINSSFGIGPDFSQTYLNGPSIFPVTSLATRVKLRPAPGFRIQAAVFDGVAGDPDDPYGTEVILDPDNGLLLAGEVAWYGGPSPAPGRGGGDFHTGEVGRGLEPAYESKVALGLWGYTRDFPRHETGSGDPSESTGKSFGGYALAEARMFAEAGGRQGLWGFLRAGVASADVNQVGSYVGGGVSYLGPIPGRDRDEVGLGIAAARNGDRFVRSARSRGTPVERWEVAVELTYRVALPGGASLQPDLQWIVNPGMDPALGDAWVLGVRGALEL